MTIDKRNNDGKRADFYVGKGAEAEWIGSIALDGYRDGIDDQILQCTSPEAFRHAVKSFLGERDHATTPEQGWPWPWNTSATTDCSYWHFGGKTWESISGHFVDCYAPCDQPELDEEEPDYEEQIAALERINYPDMETKKNVTMGPRSGLIVIGVGK